MDDEKSKIAALYMNAGLGEQFAWAIANGIDHKEIMDMWESEWWKQYDDKDALIIAVLNGKLTQKQGKWLNSIRSDHERLALTCVENPDMIEWAKTILETEFNKHPELIEGILDGGEPEVLARIVNMEVGKDLLPPALENSVELKNPPSHLRPKEPPMDAPPEMPSMPSMPWMLPALPMDAPPEMPPMPEMPQVSLPIVPSRGEKQGTVKFFNYAKGYGFIEGEGEDLPFVYISEVTGEITEGDTVSFDDSIGPKGRVAMNVSLINKRDISCPICSTEDDGFSSACSACGFAL
jgi:CspA family cold shock protein